MSLSCGVRCFHILLQEDLIKFDANWTHFRGWDQKLTVDLAMPLVFTGSGMTEVLNSNVLGKKNNFETFCQPSKVFTWVENIPSTQPLNPGHSSVMRQQLY